MSFRPSQRLFTTFRQTFFRQPRQTIFRRGNQTAATPEQGGIAKLWNSPIGPKTVHFWAPIMKWSLVLAGASDLTRSADQLSLSQNFALMCTGMIWTRWCFVIRPKNIFLASVNFCLFLVGGTQVGRILSYQQSVKGVEGEAKAEGKELKEELKGAVEKVEKAVK